MRCEPLPRLSFRLCLVPSVPHTRCVGCRTCLPGFFLQQSNVLRQGVYEQQIQSIFELSNAIEGLNPACISANTGAEWRCNFAPTAFAHVRAPVFVIDSSIDSWQSGCIMTATPIVGGGGGNCAAVEGWEACGADISSCTQTQMYAVVGYQGQFVTQLTTVPSFAEQRNSAFIHSCFTHCAAMGDGACICACTLCFAAFFCIAVLQS